MSERKDFYSMIMADRLTVVEVFNNFFDAELARQRLDASGIQAFVVKDDAGGTRPELQLARGVRLLVAADEVESARQLLHSHESHTSKDWTCSGCGETIEGQFTECWQCGSSRPR